MILENLLTGLHNDNLEEVSSACKYLILLLHYFTIILPDLLIHIIVMTLSVVLFVKFFFLFLFLN